MAYRPWRAATDVLSPRELSHEDRTGILNPDERSTTAMRFVEVRDRGPVPWGALAGLTMVGAVLRAIGLNRQLWLDEIYFVLQTVRRPLPSILTLFPGDNQHMLYSVLARISVIVFGEHPWSLRLPSVLFGVAAIPALYFLGRELSSRREALMAAALLTVSYHHVWFSQNARGYTGLLFWTLVSTMYLLRGMRSGKRSDWLFYAVTAALGAYTHLTMVFVVVSHAILCGWLLLFPREDEEFRLSGWKLPAMGVVLSGVFTLILYAPVLFQVEKYFSKPSKLEGVSTPAWAFWETLRGLRIGTGEIGLAVAGVLFLCGLVSYWRYSRVAAAVFVLPGLVTAAGALVARGTMYPRFYFYLLGFGILIVVRGAMVAGAALAASVGRERVSERGAAWGTALIVLAIVASAVMLVRNYRYPKQDFGGAMRFVETQGKTGEAVVTAGGIGYVYREYYGQSWAQVDTVPELDAIRNQGHRFWLLYMFPRYLEYRSPGLLGAVQRACARPQVFPGTVGGGEIFVCTVEPVAQDRRE